MRMQTNAVAPMLKQGQGLSQTKPAITARLWTMPISSPDSLKEHSEPQPLQSEIPSESAPPKPQASQVASSEPQASQVASSEPQPRESAVEPSQASEENVELVESSELSPSPSSAVTQNPKGTLDVSSYQSAAQRHLSAWQARQDRKNAEEASRDYAERRNNPIGEIPEFTPRLSEEEKLLKAIVKDVNCEKGANAAITAVMGFFGGAVRCSERGDFQKHIDKRLHERP
ncbi:hypothetical protein [Lacimicrobium sp. SS2-24]|uniref:hypothetical protein n=1 Tax=Lacimicrobium sp. SS2-24 TaxID=2005569 RepID=UPI000B4B5C35|nr:hypothetical protein [Lacimicrobium sp. SS2-24]